LAVNGRACASPAVKIARAVHATNTFNIPVSYVGAAAKPKRSATLAQNLLIPTSL
jgi:hypothetical protein